MSGPARFRRRLLVIHRYAGVFLAFFLAVVTVTGILLTFRSEIDRLFNPELFFVDVREPVLSAPELAARVEEADDRLLVSYLPLQVRPGHAVMMTVVPRGGPDARAPSAFAKMVEIFDARDISFVSITQQFNTTMSMGRLTLNVLLSFAQFEREVTGERIRDKIAASKKKGMWMGGHVPLGYEARDRTLVINPVEAKAVQSIFRLYLEHGCVNKLKAAADAAGLRSRLRTRLDATTTGGGSFSRGHLYAILRNPIYIGRIAHKGQTYPGAHEAIIDMETWDAVQDQLAANRKARRHGTNAKEPSLVAGLLLDANGQPLTPSHAVKSGKRYRYYVSRHLIAGESSMGRGWRIPAGQIETLVREELCKMLFTKSRLLDALGEGMNDAHLVAGALEQGRRLGANLRGASPSEGRERLAELLAQIVMEENCVTLVVSCAGLRSMLGLGSEGQESVEIKVPVTLKRRGRELKLVVEGQDDTRSPDAALIKSIVRARSWFEQLKTGDVSGTAEIAESEGLTQSYVTRVMRPCIPGTRHHRGDPRWPPAGRPQR